MAWQAAAEVVGQGLLGLIVFTAPGLAAELLDQRVGEL